MQGRYELLRFLLGVIVILHFMAPHIPGGEMLRLWKTLKNINLGRYHKWN